MTWMIIRLILSLGFIAVVLLLAARLAKKRGLGQGNGLIEVVARQRMGRTSTVNVVRIADVVLVVGATEEQVTLLAEVDAEAVDVALRRARVPARPAAPPSRRRAGGVAPALASPARSERRAGRLGLRPRRLEHARAPAARADGPPVMTRRPRAAPRRRRPRRPVRRAALVLLLALLCTVAVAPAGRPGLRRADGPGRPRRRRSPRSSPVTAAWTSPSATARRARSITLILAITVLSIAPSVLLLATSFTKIIVVLGLTRNALGLPSSPPNQVLTGIALFLTLFVMGPVFSDINDVAVQPYMDGTMTVSQAYDAGVVPLRSSCSTTPARTS